VVVDICFRMRESVRVGIFIGAAAGTVVVFGKSADWMVDVKRRGVGGILLEGQ